MDQEAFRIVRNVQSLIANNRLTGKELHDGIPKEALAEAVRFIREGRLSAAPKGKGSVRVTAEGKAEADALMASLEASFKPKETNA